MSYTDYAYVNVTNNMGGSADITLSHEYSDDNTYHQTWNNVPNGGTTPSRLTCGYNTGFVRTGQDYWWIGVVVHDGPNAGYWQLDVGSLDSPSKQCTLESEDSGKNLTFSVDTSQLFLGLISGSCTEDMERVSDEDVAKGKRQQKEVKK